MDVSDSVCKSILFSCTDIWTSSSIASSFEISVPQAQLQIVRDQRLAIARKIHAKFKVIEGAHDEPVAMDGDDESVDPAGAQKGPMLKVGSCVPSMDAAGDDDAAEGDAE